MDVAFRQLMSPSSGCNVTGSKQRGRIAWRGGTPPQLHDRSNSRRLFALRHRLPHARHSLHAPSRRRGAQAFRARRAFHESLSAQAIGRAWRRCAARFFFVRLF
ncbi:hypothetical protein JQ557_01930 [Bradyrhizobium sp. U87765 SZCCT0131]|uniref:hypothetical protein n=1 Tax=unclassified Bradyrhizobium TaxID=2631580 RepID=UPI001BA4835F|nr:MULTISPECIES: hypothetical protein [unclassified Bradyrhizobium]MBR1216734.1 hypothetical protein [Bradyrhizobium sp. U87765 SZCCT0131]MBR1259510.1 hypothetical protein [Bradyrhizobium sp. U87765 SZCCT0134]MBR1305651.1 hypothetical protein [Bradyrhizobium sp. U87765 SZCCT0110]MBR1322018.1 hypothetical protein [Bradyrhizobium sp. U87765 SZCCT0109]MBR1350704.1 hypothetical protein [Bradyrhizobium sp. U87765 SZCCT0048]